MKNIVEFTLVVLLSLASSATVAEDTVATEGGSYRIQPGDALRVSVWKETDLQQDLLVRPDGGFSFPLAGDLAAAGHTVAEIQHELVARIEEYIPDPVVTVQVLQTEGNTIYVLGKVQRPGAYVMNRPLDVTQALALAGGLAVFADEKEISILRRGDGAQSVLKFNYSDIAYGRSLEQNVTLHPGDVVLVP